MMEMIPLTTKQLLIRMIKPYKYKMAAFFGLTLLGVLCWTASPFVVRTIVNELSQNGSVDSFVWLLAGVFFLLRFLDEMFWRIGEYVMRSFKPQMIESVRTLLFQQILQKPHAYFVNNSSGRIGHWINQTTATANDIVDTTIWSVWGRSIGLVSSAAFLMFASPALSLLFSVWLVLLFWFTIKRGRKFGELVGKQSDETSKASGYVVDSLSNHISVRVFNARPYEFDRLKKQQRHIIRRWRLSWRHNAITNLVKGLSTAIVNGLAMVLVLYMYSDGTVQVGDIVLFLAYFTDASNTLWELAWSLDSYYRSFGTIDNALEGMNKGGKEHSLPVANTVQLPKTFAIHMEDVTFSYPDQPTQKVLTNLNLHINEGERIGLVGHSGAGKSTLVGLLLRFYEVNSGTFTIGGVPVKNLTPTQLRELIAYVPQDTNLFSRSIHENIAYARPDASDDLVVKAAVDAHAHEFIKKLPHAYKTEIGERGVKLSGGQRQRIAIARALLKDAPILLLDEATSALDSASEQSIQKALLQAMEGRTAIVIAHRLSTLKHLDRILVFDDGRIIEQGTHDQLVEAGGLYADLWKRQKDGFIGE